MKNIGIIGAIPQEVEIIKNNIKNLKETKIGGCKFFTGTILNHKVTLTQSGIGKVAATIGTTILIENFKPDVIINTGSAGSLKDHFNIGEVVVSTNVTHHTTLSHKNTYLHIRTHTNTNQHILYTDIR